MTIAAQLAGRVSAELAGLLKNILNGVRLSFLLKVYPSQFRVSLTQAILLLIVSILLNLTYDYVTTRPENYFNIFGLYYQAMLYFLFFLSLVIMTAVVNSYRSILSASVLILSATPTTFITYLALHRLVFSMEMLAHAGVYWILLGAYLCWHLVIVFRVVRLLFYVSIPRVAGIMFIYIVFNLLPWFVMPNQPLWVAGFNVDDMARNASDDRIDLEKLFYDQPLLVKSELDALLPERPDITDLYFLGVAGYSNEDVFMNEVKLARKLFDEKFGTKGRSLLLVNNHETLATHPMANNHNLGVAIKRVGEILDRGEDVIFIYLTSHGEEDGGLSIRVGNHSFNQITPETLVNALRGSGIKWRVIVISACYSGSFIDELRDPYSLIITAARYDRSSFGCGHDGDFTYFGQAFISEALRENYSFTDAFETAKMRITAREDKEHLLPSMPQMAVGREMERLLLSLADQFQKQGSPHTLAGGEAYQ